jgi:hypothetical protein
VYLVVSYSSRHGKVVRPGLSLVQAYHLLGTLGRGAIFRERGYGKYARPVYPRN